MHDYSTPQRKFEVQRDRAKARGIAWELTFDEWWAIWQASGKWERRGVTKGCYVMGRFGDVGPYSASNVFICTHAQNIKDAQLGHQRGLGSGRGWTYRTINKTRPYQVVISRKYIGVYATQEEAEAAYAAGVEKLRLHDVSIFSPTSDKH